MTREDAIAFIAMIGFGIAIIFVISIMPMGGP